MSEPLELWAVAPTPRGQAGYPRLLADEGALVLQRHGGHRRTFWIPEDISTATVDDESSKLILRGPSGDSVLTLDPELWVPRHEQLDDRDHEDVDLDGQWGSRKMPRRFARLLTRLGLPLWNVKLTARSIGRGELRIDSPSTRLGMTAAGGILASPMLAGVALLVIFFGGGWEAADAMALPLGLGLSALAAVWSVAFVVNLLWSFWFPNRYRSDRPGATVLRPWPQVPVDAALAHRSLIAANTDAIAVVHRGREVRYPRRGPFRVYRLTLRTADDHPVEFALTGATGVPVATFVWGWWFPDGDPERLRGFAREVGLELAETPQRREPGDHVGRDVPSPWPLDTGHWAVSMLLPFLPLLGSALSLLLGSVTDHRFSDIVAGLGAAGAVACLAGMIVTGVHQRRADRPVAPEPPPEPG